MHALAPICRRTHSVLLSNRSTNSHGHHTTWLKLTQTRNNKIKSNSDDVGVLVKHLRRRRLDEVEATLASAETEADEGVEEVGRGVEGAEDRERWRGEWPGEQSIMTAAAARLGFHSSVTDAIMALVPRDLG
ncbi:hypothetical protein E2562_007757 [Oryza meyeriana var. granulata]|uniref:Uncharacterized protein n=1 Tax=Oryza meyeriana var. granulata TaxID=110450 RepID=A0A6G1EH42_9ORYZ|nr:hypothetical protein E2562_007757 [Oryza meyeriana var. granulata]